MSRLMGLYAQHLSAGVAPPAVNEETFARQVEQAGNVLADADMVVCGMTPSIIEIPFWEMTRANPNAFYLRVNMGKASEPRQLEGRSLTVTGDIANVFDMLTNEQETKEQDA